MTILRLPLASLLFCAAGLFTACGGSEELAGRLAAFAPGEACFALPLRGNRHSPN